MRHVGKISPEDIVWSLNILLVTWYINLESVNGDYILNIEHITFPSSLWQELTKHLHAFTIWSIRRKQIHYHRLSVVHASGKKPLSTIELRSCTALWVSFVSRNPRTMVLKVRSSGVVCFHFDEKILSFFLHPFFKFKKGYPFSTILLNNSIDCATFSSIQSPLSRVFKVDRFIVPGTSYYLRTRDVPWWVGFRPKETIISNRENGILFHLAGP